MSKTSLHRNRNGFRLLVDLLHPAGKQAGCRIEPEDWTALVVQANRCALTGALGWRLREHGLWADAPPEVRDYLLGAEELGRLRSEAQLRQALELLARLKEQGLPAVLLKGTASLMTGLYPDICARICTDIDLLIPEPQMETAWSLMLADGYRPFEGNSDVPFLKHAPRLFHPDRRFGVELHRQLANTNLRRILPAEEAWRCVESIAFAGTTVWVLSGKDRVVQCLFNLMDWTQDMELRHFLELRLLIVRQPTLDWTDIRDRFAGVGRLGKLEYTLQICEDLTGLPLPLDIAGSKRNASGKFSVYLLHHQPDVLRAVLYVVQRIDNALWNAHMSGKPFRYILQRATRTVLGILS